MPARSMVGAAVVALSLSWATTALPSPCGGDVGGARVACRCGDTVVSDTRLLATDPVVTQPCPLDGLTIHASAQAESITLDLAGLVLRGSSVGKGIRVTHGGSEGARIVGGLIGARGRVEGFDVGLFASGYQAIANVSHLEVTANRSEGMRLAIMGTVLEDVLASANGRDGIHLHGKGGRLIDVTSADNAEHGIRLFSHRTIVQAEADRNGRSGVVIDGYGNDVSGAMAHDNGDGGIVIRGGAVAPDGSTSTGNSADNLRVNGRRMAP